MLHPLLAGVLLVNSICVAISIVKFLTLFILSHRVIWSASFNNAYGRVANMEQFHQEVRKMKHIVFGSGTKNFVILPGLSVHSVMGLADAIAEAYKDFCEEYTVYVFDRAENIREGYTVRNMAEDTAAAMRELNIGNADVFGASQGGMIAMYLAIDHPQMVNRLILGSTLAKPNGTFNHVIDEWIRLARAKDEVGLLESFADNVYSESTLKAYRETLISSNLGISDEEYRRFIILAEACKTFDCYGSFPPSSARFW